jgi:hypothetical protein
MYQLSIWDLLESLTNSPELECDPENLTDEDIPYLRENLLIESVKSAFGESRGGNKRAPSAEAWEWITSGERDLPFSFDNCCIACGLDPERMLEWLEYYKKKFLKR